MVCRESSVQGSFLAPSHTTLGVKQSETRSAVCDDTVAIGAACDVTCTSTEPNGGFGDSGCFSCPDRTFAGTNECVDCNGARRCVDKKAHILCPDNELVVRSQCSPSTQQDPTLVVNNHVVGCTETHFADGTSCGACPSLYVSCANSSSCSVCAAGTSLSSDGACSVLQHATAQTHAGAVGCDETFTARDAGCVPCGDVFDGCARCAVHVSACCVTKARSSTMASARRGTCASQPTGRLARRALPVPCFNATDCFPAGNCVVFAMERASSLSSRSSLLTEHVLHQRTGPSVTGVSACGAPTGCMSTRTASARVCPAERLTRRVRRVMLHVRVHRAVLHRVRLPGGFPVRQRVPKQRDAFLEVPRQRCRRGCRVCNAGFYRREKTCFACDTKCRT